MRCELGGLPHMKPAADGSGGCGGERGVHGLEARANTKDGAREACRSADVNGSETCTLGNNQLRHLSHFGQPDELLRGHVEERAQIAELALGDLLPTIRFDGQVNDLAHELVVRPRILDFAVLELQET